MNYAFSSSSIRYAAAALAATACVAGCGGASNNGVAAKSPNAIVAAAANAITGVKSVRVSGSTVQGGSRIALDLNLAAGRGGSGRLSDNGGAFRLIVLKHVMYINANDSFWRHFGNNAAAQLFHGRWLRAPATGQFESLAALTDVRALFDKLLSNHGALSKGATSTIDGQKVVAVDDTTKGGTLYVAATGRPYPVEISKKGPQGGHVIFDRYNQPVSLSAPAHSIDMPGLP